MTTAIVKVSDFEKWDRANSFAAAFAAAEEIVDSWPEWKREAAAAEFDALLDEFQPGVNPRDKESL